ncbi:FAD-binding domain-containing protein [Rhodococcus sp. NPDC058521]|uniref:FAD-binding domain-containing protein n=1 Tax=Rhodococcus sp. NPDC058521 TaxID=3346536 RepID=UPI003647089E
MTVAIACSPVTCGCTTTRCSLLPGPNRVLNPIRQAERYDADGAYMRRWVPELGGIAGFDAHTPWKLLPDESAGYPASIVDHRAGAQPFTPRGPRIRE